MKKSELSYMKRCFCDWYYYHEFIQNYDGAYTFPKQLIKRVNIWETYLVFYKLDLCNCP